MKKLLALFVVVLGFSAVSFGQVSATANATAKIVSPLKIVKVNNLVFGTLAPSGTIGSVTIATDGIRTSTLGSIQLIGAAGSFNASSFTVTGETGLAYSITLPNNTDVVLSAGIGKTMAVTNFISSPVATASATLVAGDNPLLVGATIAVDATQAIGDYTGTFDVTVNYN